MIGLNGGLIGAVKSPSQSSAIGIWTLNEQINIKRQGLWPIVDTDAEDYLQLVELADGQALEAGVRDAVIAFVAGCKSDGIWNAIKASCILAGARTLSGALVPLKGGAPTNSNFVAGDYNRKTGLIGNGTNKYLDSNRNNNADPQNNQHLAVWVSSSGQEQSLYISSSVGTAGSGASGFGLWTGNYLFFRSRSDAAAALSNGSGSSTGLIGISRSSSAAYSYRAAQTNYTSNTTSSTPRNGNLMVFAEDGSTSYRSSSRLAFYSIGESLNLASLESRVTTLINAFGAAIP
jgi:hypothetical protein